MQRHQQLPALAWSAMYIKGIKRERAEVAVSDRNRALDLKKKNVKYEKQQLQQQVCNCFFQTSSLPFTSALFCFFYAVYSRACVCTAVFSPRAPPVAVQGCSYSAESFARVFKTRVAIYGRINKAPALAVPRPRSLISKPGRVGGWPDDHRLGHWLTNGAPFNFYGIRF